jgi:hypothetical protein
MNKTRKMLVDYGWSIYESNGNGNVKLLKHIWAKRGYDWAVRNAEIVKTISEYNSRETNERS